MSNKFGMFIHWGLYSQLGIHEQVLARNDMDNRVYEKLQTTFNPVNYDPEKWVLMAKNAGMKYICFTTKHHDGFCMWDTKCSTYNVMNTPYGKDVLKMLASACQKHGMLLSLYYSNPDWHYEYSYNPKSTHQWKVKDKNKGDTEKYREYIRNQLTELLTNYGKIYTLFWDIEPQYEDKSMNEFVRSLQPDILINDRGYDKGDFSTPEREIPEGSFFASMTEACQSVGVHSWGCRMNEHFYSSKFLMSSVDRIMSMGGSYLLNVGPQPDGSIDDYSKEIIEKVGDWYKRCEPSLINTSPDTNTYKLDFLAPTDPYIAVKKNGKYYFHFYNGLSATGFSFLCCPFVPISARCLNTNKQLKIVHSNIPSHFDENGMSKGPFYQIIGIDELNEPIVIEIEE